MINRKIAGGVAACALAGALAFACTLPGGPAAQVSQASIAADMLKKYDSSEWKYWGGDSGQNRYAPLDQINKASVGRLKIAWRWSADTSGDGTSSNYKSTPLLDDGVLYVPWLNHGMAAIDAGTGKTLWTFEPQPADIGGRGASLSMEKPARPRPASARMAGSIFAPASSRARPCRMWARFRRPLSWAV
jgi:quinohemoprotein ethanol dehydrogenase